jgi:hypothetical protein
MDEGRYDELLTLAEKKLSGKTVNKEKYVRAAEDAFLKVTERDMARIEKLKVSNRSGDWQEIVAIANKIERRQERLRPFLPLIADSGYQARFKFVKVEDILTYAESQIVESLYEEGRSSLRQGRGGDKRAAQVAFEKFQEIVDRRGAIRDVLTLRDEARDLGIVRVLTTVDNRVERHMPEYVSDVLAETVRSIQSSFWTQYYSELPANTSADIEVRLVIQALEIGPESITHEEIPKQRKIEDGWQYVLDARGNVTKDSLGNDIKVPKYREVRAVVVRSHQEKAASLRGVLELVDTRNQQILETRPMYLEHRFTHQGQSFFGDERALERASDRVIVGPAPFPGNESMMLVVAEMVRPALHKELNKSRHL